MSIPTEFTSPANLATEGMMDGTKWNDFKTWLQRMQLADVVVVKVGSTYYAHSSTGALISSGTVAHTLIEAAVNSLVATGGKVFLGPHTFDLVHAIDIDNISNITLEGVYGVTTLKMTVNSTAALHIGMPQTTTRKVSNMCVRNLVFDGDFPTKTNNSGFSPHGVDGGLFENFIFKNHGYRSFTPQVWATDQISSRFCIFRNFRFLNDACVFGGLQFCDFENFYFTGSLPHQNTLIDLTFGELGIAARMDDCNFRNIWVDNLSVNNAISGGFVAYFGSNQYVRNINWENVMVTCGNETPRVFHRSATLNPDAFCENIRFKNGYIQNAGNAFVNIVDFSMQDFHIKNTKQAGLHNCDGYKLDRVKIENTNTDASGSTFDKGCIYQNVASTKQIWIENSEFLDTGSSLTPQALTIRNLSTSPIYIHNCKFTGPFVVSAILLSNGGTLAGCKINNNTGYVTEAQGTSTITSGNTSVAVTHGLSYTPTAAEIGVTFTENPTVTPGMWWPSAIGATTFTVNIENDPSTSNLDFAWSVRRI